MGPGARRNFDESNSRDDTCKEKRISTGMTEQGMGYVGP